WHDVCQRIDSRLDRLEKLEKLVRFLNESGRHFADWLDQREAALSSLKSAHHLTTSKDVMDQILNLQSMQQDLESEHPRFVKFSQYSTEAASALETDNPLGASSIRRTLEEVSQRWENLVCRMDEVTQMLVRSGKVDPKKVKLPEVDFRSDFSLIPSKNGQGFIRKTVSTVVKKYVNVDQKVPSISPSSQEGRGQEFDTSFEDFCRWLDKVEANLALSTDDLSKEDQLQSY
uniref:Dystrophin n=1 Tax=Romanomermis culicivorax TaxID=13658 RepID=A0A915HIZ4_ROMCU